MKPGILVVGSSNTDMVIKADHLPIPGETILGGEFMMNAGGKGANQAVAAARLDGNVTFICKTGNDVFGRQAVQLFKDEGIDTSYLLTDAVHPSGVALITVDNAAENCIVVASGANAKLDVTDLMNARQAIEKASIVLLQLEIPIDTVCYVAETAASLGIAVVLNPAPACVLPDEIYSHLSVITPNETEASLLSGINVRCLETAKQAAVIIRDKGVATVIITMGALGALLFHEDEFKHIAAIKADAIDTTAAGDVFNGALVVAVAENYSLPEAIAFACAAAAISVTRLGAQSSAPYRAELTKLEEPKESY